MQVRGQTFFNRPVWLPFTEGYTRMNGRNPPSLGVDTPANKSLVMWLHYTLSGAS